MINNLAVYGAERSLKEIIFTRGITVKLVEVN